jgi:putative addiction module component (TIGR02574 family)
MAMTMRLTLQAFGIADLSFEDRIALVQDIWDSFIIEAGLLRPSVSECAVLDRRIAEDDATTDVGVSWEVVKVQALARWKL